MGKRLILAINPGSTSTKISLFEEDKLVFENTLRHTVEELSGFRKITDQFSFRKNLVLEEIGSRQVDSERIVAVIGRGGLLKPIESGVYLVDQKMKDDLIAARYGQHASNLGALIADELAHSFQGCLAYIVDPVVVDELQDVARISGHPAIERKSIFHALNQKAVALTYCSDKGKKYEDINLIIAHMGGGISIGAHCKGRVVDVNNAFDGEGPLSPERSGGLPAGQLAELCFSGKYSHDEIKEMITGKGGMVAYIGTNSFVEAGKMAENGNEQALLIKKAIGYQVAKEIGAAAAVLCGKVDAVILTGGLAYDKEHVASIKSMVRSLASDTNNLIVSTGRNIDKLKELAVLYSNIIPLKTDMSAFEKNSGEYLDSIAASLGSVDILINVTGLLITREFSEMPESDSRMIMEVNFFGPAGSIKALRPLMHEGSHIINISSMGGYLGSSKYKGLSYYSASKAAIACLSECLAEEFREYGIKVNCLALGSVSTEMLEQAFPGYKAPVSAREMGEFIASFALNGHKVFNGKVLPVAVTNP